ncbi:hypothetical protein [Roseicella frigidaeris]|nr:hypothetical protein [Roseicella frigidaeris]
MRTAPPRLPIAALTPDTADPIRGAMQAMTPAFADQGRALASRPAEAAQAAAQLEFVTAAIPRDPRYAAVPESVRRDFLLARTELRDALGVAEGAAPEPVVRALVSAAQALRRGDAARAAAVLPAPMFRPGGERSVQRLGELGPLPQCAIASANLAQVVARLDATGGWPGGRPSETNASLGSSFGFGADTSVGY